MKVNMTGFRQLRNDFMSNFDKRFFMIWFIAALLITSYLYFFKGNIFKTNIVSQIAGPMSHNEIYFYKIAAWRFSGFLVLFLLALLLNIIVDKYSIHKMSPLKYTFTLGDRKMGFRFVLYFSIFVTIIYIVMTIAGSSYFNSYLIIKTRLASSQLTYFILHEIFQFSYFAGFEYFFRGYLLFESERVLGYNAILVTLLPYMIIKYGKPPAETFTAIFVAIAFGYITLKTRSFWYSVFAHSSMALICDLFAIFNVKY